MKTTPFAMLATSIIIQRKTKRSRSKENNLIRFDVGCS